MAIERYEVETYVIDYKCDICGKGYYRPIGSVHLTNPITYPHKCDVCGAMIDVRGYTYPKMETGRIET